MNNSPRRLMLYLLLYEYHHRNHNAILNLMVIESLSLWLSLLIYSLSVIMVV